MADPTTETCPICSVSIAAGAPGEDRVIFASGPAGTRAKLWARVCQFNKKSGCINPQGESENITAGDYYKPDVPSINAPSSDA